MIEPVNNYRYTLTDRLGYELVSPLGESDFSIEWSYDHDDGKRTYGKEFGGNIVFTGAAYQRLLKLEKSVYRCELQSIEIERSCVIDGVRSWKRWFIGNISLNEGEWDLDGCSVTIKFREDKPEQCFEDNKNENVDLFKLTTTRINVNQFPGNIEIETLNCGFVTQPYDLPVFCGSEINAQAGRWVDFDHMSDHQGNEYITFTQWARQVLTLPCGADAPPDDWTLLDDNCPSGNRRYIKEAQLSNCRTTIDESVRRTVCDVAGLTEANAVFKNGVPLSEVISAFVNHFCPTLTVKSNFFQINPDEVSNINYVTGQASKVLNTIVFQKTEVKRHSDSGRATKMELTFEKLMIALKFMYNCEWRILEGQFIIEHVSYYQRNNGLNLTLPKYDKFVKGRRKYSYKNESIPKQEKWVWKEQRAAGDFPGMPIVYDNGCVTSGNRNAIKTYTVDEVMTDIEFAMANKSADSGVVSDTGVVFIAAKKEGDSYSVMTESGILEGSRPNNSLAFAQLMRDYHRHERPLKTGRLNNVQTDFFSVIPTKQGDRLAIPFCCTDEFNPDDLITTPLGKGVVEKATFNFKGSILELELLYEANANLIEEVTPAAMNKVINMYLGESVLINVFSDTLDSYSNIAGVEILILPQHGSIEVLSNLTIKYTPEPGYIGTDNFVYRFKDTFGELSNNALIAITVTD